MTLKWTKLLIQHNINTEIYTAFSHKVSKVVVFLKIQYKCFDV